MIRIRYKQYAKRYIKQEEKTTGEIEHTIHYFITWFEYNDHHEKCIRHVHMGGMKPE
jgi:hypothetical protein